MRRTHLRTFFSAALWLVPKVSFALARWLPAMGGQDFLSENSGLTVLLYPHQQPSHQSFSLHHMSSFSTEAQGILKKIHVGVTVPDHGEAETRLRLQYCAER